ncbi:hypothetical protein ACF053_15500 [Streptomyces kanasensis]|uniref:hypothetical protein n=1 Tax=Streptomyces kanasensis TaxID=936756 RepID=UPI0036F539B9
MIESQYWPASTLDGVPDVEALTAGRRRGRDCVYCGAPLTGDAAVGLGEQHYRPPWGGPLIAWWPRSCPTCHETRGVRRSGGRW